MDEGIHLKYLRFVLLIDIGEALADKVNVPVAESHDADHLASSKQDFISHIAEEFEIPRIQEEKDIDASTFEPVDLDHSADPAHENGLTAQLMKSLGEAWEPATPQGFTPLSASIIHDPENLSLGTETKEELIELPSSADNVPYEDGETSDEPVAKQGLCFSHILLIRSCGRKRNFSCSIGFG
jgi:hypothetical protein